MAMLIRQSTAVEVAIGPFVDSTDGSTPETGLTISQADIRLKKNGAAWAQKNAAQTLSHEENGWYEVALDATDTGTVGQLILFINKAGALPAWREFEVVSANYYDAITGADVLQVDVSQFGNANGTFSSGIPAVNATQLGGTAQTGRDIGASVIAASVTAGVTLGSGAITAAAIATDALSAVKFASDAITKIQTGLPTTTTINAVKAKTDLIPADPATASGVSAGLASLNNLSSSQAKAALVAALTTDTYGEPTGAPGATVSLEKKLAYVYMALRNGLTVTNSAKTFLDDSGSPEWSKSISDNGTQYSEGEGA